MKKFSVRDLFFVVTIAAILCGWWLDNRRNAEEIANLRRQLPPIRLQNISSVYSRLPPTAIWKRVKPTPGSQALPEPESDKLEFSDAEDLQPRFDQSSFQSSEPAQ